MMAAKVVPIAPTTQLQEVQYLEWYGDQTQTHHACKVIGTLVDALTDDPMNSYFGGNKRAKFTKSEVKGYLKALPSASNFIATADHQAVALWQLLPLETPKNAAFAGWTRIFIVPVQLWAQLWKLEQRYISAHESVAKQVGSYYYLSFIGTRPEAQGRGYGSRLLSHITQKADAEGRWCLLEATTTVSEAWYTRHGFMTYDVFRVSAQAPPVFFMKRQPMSTLTAATAHVIGVAALTPVSGAAAEGLPAGIAAKRGLEHFVQVLPCDPKLEQTVVPFCGGTVTATVITGQHAPAKNRP